MQNEKEYEGTSLRLFGRDIFIRSCRKQHSHNHDRRNQMTRKKKGVTRRRFLEQVGLAGGSAAMYETMTALGLINLPEAWAGPPNLPQGSGTGKQVVILGAGIAGLTAAYELTRANYNCQIIELTERAGGRNHTARRGTVLKEINDKGQTTEH